MPKQKYVTEKTFAVIVVNGSDALIYQSNDLKLLAAKVKEAKKKKLHFVCLAGK